MDPRDVFVQGSGFLDDETSPGAQAQQWLQALPGTVYITDARWWLGELRFLSETIATLSQHDASHYRSQPERWLTQIGEVERHRLLERLQQALTQGETCVRLSYVIVDGDETPHRIEDDIRILRDADGEAVALFGVMRTMQADSTLDERRPRRSSDDPALRGQNSPDRNSRDQVSPGRDLCHRLLSDRHLLNHSDDLILALDDDLACLDIVGNTRAALGVVADAWLGMSLFELMAPEDGSRVQRLLIEGAAESTAPMVELRLRHRDGEYRWFEIQFSPFTLPRATDGLSQSASGWLAVARNVTQRRQQSLQWNALVTTDELTSALKREPFMGLVNQAFASGDGGARFTLILFSVDHFSDINHARGREGGDLVLSCIGEMCRATLRERFSFGRLDGDTFALLMSDKSLQETAVIAERLRARFAATRVEFHGHWLAFSVSLGVAERRAGESAEAMLARTEAGMLAARELGRDRVQQAP